MDSTLEYLFQEDRLSLFILGLNNSDYLMNFVLHWPSDFQQFLKLNPNTILKSYFYSFIAQFFSLELFLNIDPTNNQKSKNLEKSYFQQSLHKQFGPIVYYIEEALWNKVNLKDAFLFLTSKHLHFHKIFSYMYTDQQRCGLGMPNAQWLALVLTRAL